MWNVERVNCGAVKINAVYVRLKSATASSFGRTEAREWMCACTVTVCVLAQLERGW